MKITLELVRQVMRETLGFESFVASFISAVEEDANEYTASITKEGRLRYSPDFIGRYVDNSEDLFCLIFHELLHPMLGHFIHGSGELENIAADAVINAAISMIYAEPSRDGSLFKKLYKPCELEGILRPKSVMYQSRYAPLYGRLYGHSHERDRALSTGELIQTLKILVPRVQLTGLLLIGSHRAAGDGQGGLDDLPADVLGRMAEEIRRSAREQAGKRAGYSEALMDLFMQALRSRLSLRRVLLRKFVTQRKVDRFKEQFERRRWVTTPIPLHPSKRDLVLLAAGLYPCRYRCPLSQSGQRRRGLAVYLDVSGSVNEYLPRILGILKSLDRELLTVFQFSNKVVETPFKELLKGKIQTTGGTDFDCIAHSILERGFERAVIITDGCAGMNGELKARLKARRLKTLTILFNTAQTCEDFEPLGEVVLLEDAVQ